MRAGWQQGRRVRGEMQGWFWGLADAGNQTGDGTGEKAGAFFRARDGAVAGNGNGLGRGTTARFGLRPPWMKPAGPAFITVRQGAAGLPLPGSANAGLPLGTAIASIPGPLYIL